MFASQEPVKGGKGGYNNGGGNQQYGNQQYGNQQQQQQFSRPPLPEVKMTSNGRWNRDSTTAIKLLSDWPIGDRLADGSAGANFLPRVEAIRMDELIPLLPISREVDDVTFTQFKAHLGTFAGNLYPSKTIDQLWTDAGMPIKRPEQPATVKLEEKFDRLLDLLGSRNQKPMTRSNSAPTLSPTRIANLFSGDLSGSPETKAARLATTPAPAIPDPAAPEAKAKGSGKRRGPKARGGKGK